MPRAERVAHTQTLFDIPAQNRYNSSVERATTITRWVFSGRRAFMAGLLGALMLAGCSAPTPDAVVTLCTDAVAAKKYERVLPYCTPALQQVYSNNLLLAQYHRNLESATTFVIEPAELDGMTAAVVRLTMTIAIRQYGSSAVALQLNLVKRGKWYVDTVWRVDANGTTLAPALPDVPAPLF